MILLGSSRVFLRMWHVNVPVGLQHKHFLVWCLWRRNNSIPETSWNVMTHAQKPDFVFLWNGRVHLNRRGGGVQSTTGNRGVPISGSNAGYTMFRGSVKCTGYTLHSPVSPSLPLLCVTVCHHISTGVYHLVAQWLRFCATNRTVAGSIQNWCHWNFSLT